MTQIRYRLPQNGIDLKLKPGPAPIRKLTSPTNEAVSDDGGNGPKGQAPSLPGATLRPNDAYRRQLAN